MIKHKLIALSALLACFMAATGSVQAGWNPFAEDKNKGKTAATNKETQAAIARFRSKDPSMKVFFNRCYAYAIFPTVGKGGIGIGGAYGKGSVIRGGRVIGRTSLSQVTIGFQFGGQAYSEIIFFKDRKAFQRFASGNLKLSAQASAVAATAGAAANADYSNGVAIFTITKGGLMYEATVGGQKFSYTPVR